MSFFVKTFSHFDHKLLTEIEAAVAQRTRLGCKDPMIRKTTSTALASRAHSAHRRRWLRSARRTRRRSNSRAGGTAVDNERQS